MIVKARLWKGKIAAQIPFELKNEVTCRRTIMGYKFVKAEKPYWEMPYSPFTAMMLNNFEQVEYMDQEIPALYQSYLKALEAKVSTDLPPHLPGIKHINPKDGTELKPWLHQRQAYWFCKDLPGSMLAFDMGTGKSLTAVALTVNAKHDRVIIVCPKSVIPVWPQEFKYAIDDSFMFYAAEGRKSVEAKSKQLKTLADSADRNRQPFVFIVNYDAFWREEMKKVLLNYDWDVMIADECCIPGTMIATPEGDRKIEDIKAGDIVWGFDHENNQVVKTEVKATFDNKSSNLLDIERLTLTGNHPVWTVERGYVRADSLTPLDTVCYIGSKGGYYGEYQQTNTSCCMPEPGMRERFYGRQAGETLLQQELQCEAQVCLDAGDERNIESFNEQDESSGRCAGETKEASSLKIKSFPQSRSSTQSSTCLKREGLCAFERRKREEGSSASAASGCQTGMEDGACCSDQRKDRFRIPNGIQDRHCRSDLEDRSGGGRQFSFDRENQGQRQEERPIFNFSRVDNIQVHKQGSNGQPGGSCKENLVYNFETLTGNYFADGLLVHNCHRAKNPGNSARASRFLTRLARQCKKRIGLTGTPMPHSPLDIFAQYRALDPAIYGENYHRFKMLYAEMGGFGGKQVMGYKNMDELSAKFKSIAIQASKDVLDLPEFVHDYRSCELCPKAKKIYQSLNKQLFAEIEEGTCSPANAMVKVLRLQQLTSGYIALDNTERLAEVDTGKRDLLKDVLEDLPQDEPVVVFCRFTADIRNVRKVADDLKRPVSELSGKRNDLKAWQDGKTTVLAVQIRSGGVGIDLTRAAYCIYYSVGHSLGDYLQSLDRTHRYGQKRNVTYYHLLAEDTIDGKVYQALMQKKDIIDSILKREV